MRTKLRLVDKELNDDNWIGYFENLWRSQNIIIINLEYPDDIDIGEVVALELQPIQEPTTQNKT